MMIRLYGKKYDASRWARWHPGGSAVIESACSLEEEVVERLFESSHRYPEKNLEILEEYVIADSPRCASTVPASETSKGRDDPFRDELRGQVFAYLRREYPENSVGRGGAYGVGKCLGCCAIWSWCIIGTLQESSSVCGILARAMFAGFVLILWGFIQFHDASHFVFGSLATNHFLAASWAALSYWPPWICHKHHVELHHTCTGEYSRDPDLRHGSPFMRKTSEAPPERYYNVSAPWQLFSMFVFPGMYFGQVFQYFLVRFGIKRSLWKMKGLVSTQNSRAAIWENVISFWFPVWVALLSYRRDSLAFGLLTATSYVVSANVSYAANILPDHDTDASHANVSLLRQYLSHDDQAKRDIGKSWYAHQVAASANWAGRKWCFVFGGINYQIEHHLFPRIHHSFYPEIAPIVRKTCQKHGVPYVHYPTFSAAAAAVYNQVLIANQDVLSIPDNKKLS